MNNEFILNLENEFQGINTRLKELHFSSQTMSIHRLIDDFTDEFREFEDAIMENAQALWGFIKPGDLNPVLPDALEFEELLVDLRGKLTKVKIEAKDNLMWTGIINRVDDFFETVNSYIYQIKICKHEAGKED